MFFSSLFLENSKCKEKKGYENREKEWERGKKKEKLKGVKIQDSE